MRYTVNYMKYSVFTEEIPVRIEAEFSSYPPLMRTLLYRRGLHTRADAEKFLAPDYERDIRDPFLIHDMDRAVARIFVAIRAQEHIVVYGDYDCDGIPGSVVLHDFFKKSDMNHARTIFRIGTVRGTDSTSPQWNSLQKTTQHCSSLLIAGLRT